MQGIHTFIPTQTKIEYINKLLTVGFNTIDFGSFVSPKAIPQLADTHKVLEGLHLDQTKTQLLAIIANPRGANDAVQHEQIRYLGYPFSISETFQMRNTNRGIAQAFEDVKEIQELCSQKNKELVIYISMGFGNPYGDPWSADVAEEWLEKLRKEGITIFSLADTVGTANAADISYLFSHLIPAYPQLEIGSHFHSTAEDRYKKIQAAYENGCKRFDSAMLGFGGCPMAEDELVGNISTEFMLGFLEEKGEHTGIDMQAFNEARIMASEIFGKYS
jgi:hydroxymethylglutaryl-CoA lyase